MSFWTTLLPFGLLSTSESDRTLALASPSIENLGGLEQAALLISDGKQSAAALPLVCGEYDGAVYSSRGRGYARYNEDAAGLFFDEAGRMYAMAFDQAGGLGGERRGRASHLAAKEVITGCQAFAKAGEAGDTPIHSLLEAFLRAHTVLLARGEGEVTTAIVAVLQENTAYLMNSGDSGAVLFNAKGEIKSRTIMHEFPPPDQSCLRHALGLEPEGCEPTPYTWSIDAGDWLLLGSDGLLDSGMVEEEIGAMLPSMKNAEDAVNRICTHILRRMGTLRAKPDNLSVLLIHAPSRD